MFATLVTCERVGVLALSVLPALCTRAQTVGAASVPVASRCSILDSGAPFTIVHRSWFEREELMSALFALRIIAPFSLGYFLSYAVRNVSGYCPRPECRPCADAATLGLGYQAYFLAFAAFQIPLGVLLDRYGSRRVEAISPGRGGMCLIALGQDVETLVAARAFIGLGVSAALMGSFKAYVQWFPAERLPLISSLTMTMGGLGALVATAPVEAMLGFMDWRGVLWVAAAVATLAAATIFCVAPAHPDEKTAASVPMWSQVRELSQIYTSADFWRIAPLAVTSQAMFLAIQGLWAGPWFRDVAGLGRDDVAAHLLYITIAMVVGFFSVGVVMERLARVGISNLAVASTYCLLALLALVVIMLEWQLPSLFAWLVFGFFGGAGFLFYPLLCGYFKEELAGRVVTSANVLTFGGAFVAQWAIGAVINQWPVIENGNFHPAGYQAGFALFGGMTLISLIWVILAPGTKRSTRAAS